MQLAEIEREYQRLKAQRASGALSEADLKARLQELMVEDEQGRWWMIGYETGQWYVHDGEKWVRAEPPVPQEKSPVTTPPVATPPPVTTPLPVTPSARWSEPEKPAPAGKVESSRSWLR